MKYPRLKLDIGEIDALIDYRNMLIQANKFAIEKEGSRIIPRPQIEKWLRKNIRRRNNLIFIKDNYWPK